MNPLISICIPVYNGERWLRECLDSALRCSLPCEIIVVDDGSTDGSFALCKSYAEQDARIAVFRNERNLGLTGNWNRCLALAKGEWVKFLFQDDVLGEQSVEKMVSAAGENDVFVAARRNFIFDADSSAEARKYYTESVLTLEKLAPRKIKFTAAEVVALAAANPARNFIGEPSTVIFRKRLAGELGEFDTGLRQICDIEYWLRITTKYGFVYAADAVIDFRIHETSVSSQNAGGRKYISTYLDPVRAVGAQLFGKHYAAFREYLSAGEMKRLKLWLRMRAYEAVLAAKEEDAKKELGELFRLQPELAKLAAKSFNGILYRLLQLRRGRS